MKYIPDCVLKYFIKIYFSNALSNLKSAQLTGKFKSEAYLQGQIDLLKFLNNDLKLNINLDKLKF